MISDTCYIAENNPDWNIFWTMQWTMNAKKKEPEKILHRKQDNFAEL